MTELLAAECAAALIVFALFLIIYNVRTSRVRWWRSEYGRMLVTLTGSIAALLANGLASYIFHGYPYHRAVSAILLACLIAAGMWLVVLMVEALPSVDPPDPSDEPEND